MDESGLLESCSELLNAIVDSPENQKCFDCTDKFSPRYLCTNFSTFVCSCCATIHKEFGHTIKCLNVFTFTLSEMYLLKDYGNKIAADKWLALWMPGDREPDPTSPTYREDARKYMKAKYIDKKWCLIEAGKSKIPSYAQQHDDKAPTPYASMTAHACAFEMDSVITNPFPALPGMQQYMSPQRVQEPMTFPPSPFPASADMSRHSPYPYPNPIPFQFLDTQTIDSEYNSCDVPPPLPPRPYEGRANSCRSNLNIASANAEGIFSLSPQMEYVPQMENAEDKGLPPQSGGMLRSSSENSIARMRNLALRSGSTDSDAAHDVGMRAKWKVQGIMNKMADLLSPKRTQISS